MSKFAKSNKQMRRAEQAPLPAKTAGGNARRWVFLGLALVLAAGASWAFFEFVVWNKLPSELVGKWDVVEGTKEYKEATFEFFRNGTMEATVNEREMVGKIYATIRVDGNKLFSTTRNKAGQEHTAVFIIRTLTARELVVEDEQGKRMKMKRAE
jgi:uncharacterized protein (TIGR03066 family)